MTRVAVHGSSAKYNRGCRCDVCREGNRRRHLAYMHRTGRAKPLSEHLADRRAHPPDHGTESRYSRPHNCRCEDCTRAVREGRQRRRIAARV